MSDRQVFRGAILHFLSKEKHEYFEDGVLVVENGLIKHVGKAGDIEPTKTFEHGLIVPGFIDAHTHYAQTDIVGSFGEQVLDWLEKYTFPAEKAFSDEKTAREAAKFFLGECFRHGTTTAAVFATVHPTSVTMLFEEALKVDMRLIGGKVLMDRNAPSFLIDTVISGYEDSRRLIKEWHGKGRISYALTPRFAPTSTPEQLLSTKKLIDEFPDVYLQTHLSENLAEIEWVKKLFPTSKNYLDVYDSFGFLRKRSLFAHCVHLNEKDFNRLAESGAASVFCPTSNLFLGSGLFDLALAEKTGTPVAIGTDIGAGTSFSLLQTLNEAYKVGQLRGNPLRALHAFYLLTLGGAKALRLDDKIGNFVPGKEADFAVLHLLGTPLLARRLARAKSIDEKLFTYMTLGVENSVHSTYLKGRLVYSFE